MKLGFGGDPDDLGELPRSSQREIRSALGEAIDAARADEPVESWEACNRAWETVPVNSGAWSILEWAANEFAAATQSSVTDGEDMTAAHVHRYICHMRAVLRLVPETVEENPHRVTGVLT